MNNNNSQLNFECDNSDTHTFKELSKKVTFNLSDLTEREREKMKNNKRYKYENESIPLLEREIIDKENLHNHFKELADENDYLKEQLRSMVQQFIRDPETGFFCDDRISRCARKLLERWDEFDVVPRDLSRVTMTRGDPNKYEDQEYDGYRIWSEECFGGTPVPKSFKSPLPYTEETKEEEYQEYEYEDQLVHFEKCESSLQMLQMQLDKERWTSVNLQHIINDLEEENSKLNKQLQEELSLSCSISQQNEKAINDVRRLKNIEQEMIKKLEDANEHGLQFAEQVSELQNELGDTQETLDFILDALKTTEDLKSLKESIDTFFREKEERYS